MKISHHIKFKGPAFIATSTDESSARETTAATPADVGIDPYDGELGAQKAEINVDTLEDGF